MMELLAPAGSYECVVAAVQSGADAVYFSGENYGARSYAENFDLSALERAADYCRLRGVKTHITVNTLCTDRELKQCAEYVRFLAKIGVDAVIVQDLGVFDMIKHICPSMPIHASTQMTAHNIDGVLMAEKLGAQRVVLSRELSLENIRDIAKSTKAELEVFAHGALCMCYSGQCLMSSVFGGRSGNRGKCAQPCRLKYSINNSDENYYLSLKDLSLAGHIKELEAAGVTSLKIEGRMKGAAYVAAVTRVFRDCIDLGKPPSQKDEELLRRVFFRDEFTDGYFTGRSGKEMFTLARAENPYKRGSAELERELKNTYKNSENIKNKIDCKVRIAEGEKPEIFMNCRGFSVKYTSDETAETAKSRPSDAETIKAQIRKTGGVPFEFEKIDVELSDSPFVPISVINELRRGGIQLLEEKIKNSCRLKTNSFEFVGGARRTPDEIKLTCSVFNSEQLRAALNFIEKFSRIYVPVYVAEKNIKLLDSYGKYREKIVLSLPAISRGQAFKTAVSSLGEAGYNNLQVNNISHMMYSEDADKNLFGGFRMNVFNSEAVRVCAENGLKSVCLSPELNLVQIRSISKCVECEVIGYGRLPLMVTENCPAQAAAGCAGCRGVNIITDRKGAKLPVARDGADCEGGERSFVILNSAPIFTADKTDELRAAGVSAVNLYFTVETPSECAEVCEMYFENKKPNFDYTRGHFNKGVI